MTQSLYPGTWSILADPTRRRDVYVWALSAPPDGPASIEDLEALRLPYLASAINTGSDGGNFALLSAAMLSGTARFDHPDQVAGPLTVRALAVVLLDLQPQLLAVQALDEPAATPGPGYALEVPVSLVAFAPVEV